MEHASINAFSVSVEVYDPRAGQFDPYVALKLFRVSDFANSDLPDYWVCEEGPCIASYFTGMDFGRKFRFRFSHRYFEGKTTAIIVSIQGINALTSKRIRETRLEQYGWDCPEHDIPLDNERYCTECRHTWPFQNYFLLRPQNIHNTFTEYCSGFRVQDGIVRQFMLTDSKEKLGVAQQLTHGNQPHQIAFAFFQLLEPGETNKDRQFAGSESMARFSMTCGARRQLQGKIIAGASTQVPLVTEVGAGKILNLNERSVEHDTDPLSRWSVLPAGIIQLNHADDAWVTALTKKGPSLDRHAGGNGSLAGIRLAENDD